MKIGIYGTGWRKELTRDILQRTGILAEYVDGLQADLTLVCGIPPGEEPTVLDFIKNGGRAIIFYPEKEITPLFGRELFYTHHFPFLHTKQTDLPFSFLQVFPTLRLIRPEEGESWATFALDFSTTAENKTSSYPAVMWRTYGKGKVGLFFYDLLATILLLQQGWEFFASDGDFPMPVKDGKYRSRDLHYSLLNPHLSAVPQAQMHELIFLRLARKLAGERTPLPRSWYFPYPHTTALILSGDSDSLDKKRLKKAWKKLNRWDVPYTQFIMLNDLAEFSPEELKGWQAKGIDFGVHYYAGDAPSPEEMRKHLAEARTRFRQKKLTLDSARGHSLVWLGWDEQVKIMAENNLKTSSNLLPVWTWGVTQGLPYPLYTRQGRSSVWEFQVFCSDDATLYNKNGHLPLNVTEAEKKMRAVLSTMQEIYYQPITPIFHPHGFAGAADKDTSPWLENIIRYCRQENIPIYNLKQFFEWWDKRNHCAGTCRIKKDRVTVAFSGLPQGLSVALPEKWNGKRLQAAGKKLIATNEILVPIRKQKTVLRYE